VLFFISTTGFFAATSQDVGPPRSSPIFALGVVGRLLMVPPLLAGLLSFTTDRLSTRARFRLLLDFVIVVGGGFMLMWYFLIGPALSMHSDGLQWLARVGFPIGDLVMVFGVCVVLLRGLSPSVRTPVAILLSGTLIWLGADVYMVWLTNTKSAEVMPAPLGLALLTGLFLLTAAAAQQCGQATQAPRPSHVDRLLRSHTWLPYLALTVGYGLLTVAAARNGWYPWLGLVAGAAVMTVGVAGRQILTLRENHALVVTDSLTGLANRLRLLDAMTRAAERSRRTGIPIAVLLIDLDGFKQVNDSFGHEAGDRLLVTFAEVLRDCVRGSDTPARLGGDEFAVLLNGVNNAEEAIEVANRILARSAIPVTVAAQTMPIRASIGIGIADLSLDADQPARPNGQELLHRADLAMYAAKRKKTHSWQLYREGAMEADLELAQMRDDLLNAVAREQLRVHYQPIVALGTGDLVAVEALVRWQHPTRGLLAPDTFIPLAEEIGVIQDIDVWVMEHACHQVRTWQDNLPQGRSLHLSVNFSAPQLARPTLAADVIAILRRTRFDPRHLVVEVTESLLVDDQSAVPQLQALRDQGVRVALDDFGTGYSSLRYLTLLPVDILKLDRCFVAELNNSPEGSAVAEAVMRLAQILHLDTVAEGIEEASQATELTLLGCNSAQGYHFARPVTAETIEVMILDPTGTWPTLPFPAATPRSTPTAVALATG
jgi:diguanylate cyclase (GGDEF)-like protein